MNIPILVERLGHKGRMFFAIFGEIIAFLFSAVILVYGGLQITSLAMGQMTSSLGVPIGIFYVVMPIAGVLNMIYAVMNIIEISNGTISLATADEKEV